MNQKTVIFSFAEFYLFVHHFRKIQGERGEDVLIICVLNYGSHGIEPKRDWTHFLQIGLVVAGGVFYSYYNLQCIKLDKEKKEFKKKISFMHKKKHSMQFLKMGSIPRLP